MGDFSNSIRRVFCLTQLLGFRLTSFEILLSLQAILPTGLVLSAEVQNHADVEQELRGTNASGLTLQLLCKSYEQQSY